MRWALIGLLALHGLIHLMGFAKAFGYAELPQLAQPISREWGVLWLLAGGLLVATAVMIAAGYGEARWRLPEGEFTYGEFTMMEVVTNVR